MIIIDTSRPTVIIMTALIVILVTGWMRVDIKDAAHRKLIPWKAAHAVVRARSMD